MPLDKFKKTLGNVAGAAGEKAKSVGGVVADKAAGAGGFVVGKAAAGKELAAQAGAEARARYYNPRFREDFFDPDFDRPDIIVVVDGDERKGIDVCEGAIGWLSKHKGTEVLHLYGEFVEESGLIFFPQPRYGAVYQVDIHDSQRYIDLSRLFEIAHRDRITELRNIAHALGAKRCKLESFESRKEISVNKARVGFKGKTKVKPEKGGRPVTAQGSIQGDAESQNEQYQDVTVLLEQTFPGSDEPKQPELKWFERDEEILSLIKMRCSRDNPIESYKFELGSSSSTTMARGYAVKLDGVLKDLKANCNFTLESECMTEERRKLRFSIEF